MLPATPNPPATVNAPVDVLELAWLKATVTLPAAAVPKLSEPVVMPVPKLTVPVVTPVNALTVPVVTSLLNVVVPLLVPAIFNVLPVTAPPMVTVFASDSSVSDYKINCGNIVRDLAKLIQGGGGGQPFFASAGGKDSSCIGQVLETAKTMAATFSK